jgi:hypothetical protein
MRQFMPAIMFPLVLSNSLPAQELPESGTRRDASRSVWIDMGVGLGAVTDFAYALSAEVRLQNDHRLITIRALYSEEIHFDLMLPAPEVGLTSVVVQRVSDVGMMYGWTTPFHLKRMLFPFFPLALVLKREADYSVSVSAGVSVLRSVLRGTVIHLDVGYAHLDQYTADQKISVGIPVEVEIVQIVSPSVGYVHRLYGNFNSERNYWGIMWGAQYYF